MLIFLIKISHFFTNFAVVYLLLRPRNVQFLFFTLRYIVHLALHWRAPRGPEGRSPACWASPAQFLNPCLALLAFRSRQTLSLYLSEFKLCQKKALIKH